MLGGIFKKAFVNSAYRPKTESIQYQYDITWVQCTAKTFSQKSKDI